MQIVKRDPQELPEYLKEFLTQYHLIEGVEELIGPRFHTDEMGVYGYYVPKIQSILIPSNSVFNEEMVGEDFEDMRREMDFYSSIQDLMCNFSGLNDSHQFEKIISEENSSDEFCNQIYQKAIKANQYSLDLFLRNKRLELLTWDEIWKIFGIEEYHLVRDGNMLIETKKFIIYLHLPEFESEDSPKSIFRYYCNNPKMPEVPYVVLSECKTQIVSSRPSGYIMEDKCYDYISSGYYGYQIKVTRLDREKPIVKFDGINYEGQGKVQFGYRYDGMYKIYAIAESGNLLLK